MATFQLTQEKLDALRSEYKTRSSQLKYPRPKTKPEYQSIYPWLLPDEIDPHFVFCTICECRLSAKRSDLGKHEGSIKHTENAQRKCLAPKSSTNGVDNVVLRDVKWEYSDDQFDNLIQFAENMPEDVKTEDMCGANQNESSDEVANDDEEEEGVADADRDGEADENDENSYEPLSKRRRASETDSQHSGLLDYLPLQVTINESPSNSTQLQSNGCGVGGAAGSQNAASTMPPQYQPSPCRITIKKVTAPMIKPINAQQGEITSKATITPITAQLQRQHQMQNQMIYAQNLAPLSTCAPQPVLPARDSFDLFFDSICATVKSLPPKLATEGKIRVMQLIGELEMRAITDKESQQSCAKLRSQISCYTS